MDTIDALRLIIARSQTAASDAMRTLRSLSSVPAHLTQQRLERAIETALRDPHAAFTPDERNSLAALLSGAADESRDLAVRFRVNADEKQRIQQMADEAGQTVSDFIRERIGL